MNKSQYRIAVIDGKYYPEFLTSVYELVKIRLFLPDKYELVSRWKRVDSDGQPILSHTETYGSRYMYSYPFADYDLIEDPIFFDSLELCTKQIESWLNPTNQKIEYIYEW